VFDFKLEGILGVNLAHQCERSFGEGALRIKKFIGI
jgi:hypothetical protein